MSDEPLSEAHIEQSILTWLATLPNVFAWKNVSSGFNDGKSWRKHASAFAIRGVPDILGFFDDGVMLAIEVKTPRGVVSDHQRSFISKAAKSNVVCGVARSLDQAKSILKAHGRISSESHE